MTFFKRSFTIVDDAPVNCPINAYINQLTLTCLFFLFQNVRCFKENNEMNVGYLSKVANEKLSDGSQLSDHRSIYSKLLDLTSIFKL